ncbi:MAG: starch-binding protein, partial [Ruminococcus sp.]|nr:starch-binding protein [Ruminococcus sp.]
ATDPVVTEPDTTKPEETTEPTTTAPITTEPETDPEVVYFIQSGDSKSWSVVKAYMWEAATTSNNNGWPGVKMTETGTNKDGNKVYSVVVNPAKADKIIFTNKNEGSVQTNNLDLKIGQYYDYETDQWVADPDNIPKPDYSVNSGYYLLGLGDDGWNFSMQFKKAKESDTIAYYTKTLAANTPYDYKITKGAAWSSPNEYGYGTQITGTVKDVQLSANFGGNAKLQSGAAGDYVFALDTSTMKLSVTYPSGSVVEPDNPSTGTDYYLIGYINGKDVDNTDYKFVNGKLTLTVTASTYVNVKNASGTKYWTNGYLGQVTEAVLKSSGNTTNDKLSIPTGTITFTLVENSDGSLKLSYTKA